jgi:hypothetical protein
VVTIPSRLDHLIPENTNDGFATQSFSHRFAVRVFYDLASLAHGQLSPERMTNFVNRSNDIMMIMAGQKAE